MKFLRKIFCFGHKTKKSEKINQSKFSSQSNTSAKVHQIVPANNEISKCGIRIRRLLKEFKEIQNPMDIYYPLNDDNITLVRPFKVELVDNNLSEWNIYIYHFDINSLIYSQMKSLGIPYVHLNTTFPDNFPFEPPFIRVVSPIIEKGFVMEGGAICMELLTKQGWTSAYTMEAVIIQLIASFVKGNASIKTVKKQFNKKSAQASFKSLVKTHNKYGWVDTPLAEG